MVVNFRTRKISRGTRKLTRTPTLIKKNIDSLVYFINLVTLIHLILYPIMLFINLVLNSKEYAKKSV